MRSQVTRDYYLRRLRIFFNYINLELDKTSGTDKAKCAEVAANIAIDVLKMESEGIKAVKDALLAEKEATRRSSPSAISSNSNNNDRDMIYYDELEESC